jgi:hypothetical protein
VLSSGHGSPTVSNVMDDSVAPSNDPKSVTFGQLVRHSALELILNCGLACIAIGVGVSPQVSITKHLGRQVTVL